MRKQTAYHTGSHFRWILALSLSLSLFTFSGYLHTAEACNPLPDQIELVVSSQSDSVKNNISYYQANAHLFHTDHSKKSRVNEVYILLNHQKRSNVILAVISKQSASFQLPVFYRPGSAIPHTGDDSPSDESVKITT